MMRHLIRTTLVIAIALSLPGCASGPATSDEPWSTRQQSVYGEELNQPSLALARPLPLRGTTVMRDAAIELLLQAIDAEDPMLRANAIEALHATPDVLEPVLRKCLVDENRAVRYIATMTIGQLQLDDLAHLLPPLLHDPSLSVQAAALYALKRVDASTDISALAGFLLQDDAETRGNAAMILGKLGNPTAAPLLRMAVRRPLSRVDSARQKIVDLQIAEAMVRLGEESELAVIRAALFAPGDQGEIVALACQISGRLGDGQALPNLLDLALRPGARRSSAEIRMAAVEAVGRIDATRMPLEVAQAYLDSELPSLRAQAALTLGSSRQPEVLADLSILLSDPNPVVQVAAAGAVLRINETPVP